MRMGEHVGQEAVLISGLVGFSIQSHALGGIEGWLSREPPAEDVETLPQTLSGSGPVPLLIEGLPSIAYWTYAGEPVGVRAFGVDLHERRIKDAQALAEFRRKQQGPSQGATPFGFAQDERGRRGGAGRCSRQSQRRFAANARPECVSR